jgi:hypothetical protein
MNLKNSDNLTWLQAKNALQRRFGLASQASAHSLVTNLVKFSLEKNESFILSLKRFRMLILESKINIEDNVLLYYVFVNCFSSKVQEKIYEIISECFRDNNPVDYKSAKIHKVPSNWKHFDDMIIGHIAAIEEVHFP